jgi:hypothetical protein
MNTKILVMLVIGIALVGLTGAAAGDNYTTGVSFNYWSDLHTVSPVNTQATAGAEYNSEIENLNNYGNLGMDSDGLGYGLGGMVQATQSTAPVDAIPYVMGSEYDAIESMWGYATQTINTVNPADDKCEWAAEIGTGHHLDWTGSVKSNMLTVVGDVGEVGVLLNPANPGDSTKCGNCRLNSALTGEGKTEVLVDSLATLTGGTFDISGYEGVCMDLSEVDRHIDVYGGSSASSTYVGSALSQGSITTTVTASDTMKVGLGTVYIPYYFKVGVTNGYP